MWPVPCGINQTHYRNWMWGKNNKVEWMSWNKIAHFALAINPNPTPNPPPPHTHTLFMKKKHEFTRKFTTIRKLLSDFVFIIQFQSVSVDIVCQASITATELRIGVVGGDIVAETAPSIDLNKTKHSIHPNSIICLNNKDAPDIY